MTLGIECRYAECRDAECRDYLNVILSVILNVVMLSVVAPLECLKNTVAYFSGEKRFVKLTPA
jgi:hypothetical protein